MVATLVRDGGPTSGSVPWEHVPQGWDKEDVTHVETTDSFDVFMSPAQLPLPKFPSEGLKSSTGTQDVQWVGGAAPVGDNPSHDKGGCAAGDKAGGHLGRRIAAPGVHPLILGCVWAGRLSHHPRVMLSWKR